MFRLKHFRTGISQLFSQRTHSVSVLNEAVGWHWDAPELVVYRGMRKIVLLEDQTERCRLTRTTRAVNRPNRCLQVPITCVNEFRLI